MKLHFVVVPAKDKPQGFNKIFENGDISLLLSYSTNKEDLDPKVRKGELATLAVKPSALDVGLTIGARGYLEGTVVQAKELRDDGKPWLRIRKEPNTPVTLTEMGNTGITGEDVVFVKAEEAPPF